MCLSSVIEIVKDVNYVDYIGWKVFRKNRDGTYSTPIKTSQDFKLREYYHTEGFINHMPCYPGGFHIFTNIDSAKKYLTKFIIDCGTQYVICKVLYWRKVVSGLQPVYTNNVTEFYPCDCALSIMIIEEVVNVP